jgi:hypothetical protein
MHRSTSDDIIRIGFLGRHMVRRKQEPGVYVATICMTLPIEVVVILDKMKKEHGHNRSATAAHIIKDWKMNMDRERRERRERRE